MVELKLIVLAGAKEGTQIPLKKDKFVIGRASECTLRAASAAISRRHCAIERTDDAWVVRDLGSRNGTHLNDQAVETPTALKVGDELRVGPLKFRVEARSEKAPKSDPATKVAPAASAPEPAQEVDINRAKQPPVKSVAEVVARAASKAEGASSEDDISRWLLGMESGSADTMRETQTVSMEETATITRGAPRKTNAPIQPAATDAADEDEDMVEVTDESGETKDAKDDKSGSGGWKFFKMGKKGGKKAAPGKLPPRPAEQSKDSREAAADILREMTRRR